MIRIACSCLGLLSLGLLLTAAPSCRRATVTAAAASTSPAPAAARPTRSGSSIRFDPASPQLERILVVPAESIVIATDELDAPARIEAVPTKMARLALPVAGRVRGVAVAIGDTVTAGQPLVTIETPELSALTASWRQAQADIRQRQAAQAKADEDVRRARDLLEHRGIARKEVMAAETEQAFASAAVDQAQAAQDDVERRMRLLGLDPRRPGDWLTLRAPMPGQVVEMSVAQGEYRHDSSAPVLTVADLRTVWVTASVPERALARVRRGQRVIVSLAAFPDESFAASVTRVPAMLDPDTRTGKVIAELPNPHGQFRPEMFARVRYEGPPRAVIRIPLGAIVHTDSRAIVFVEQRRGLFERRAVTLGPRQGESVVITTGLSQGDRVVVGGTMLLMGQ